MDPLCQIELLKDGIEFKARAHLASGSIKEYRNTVFEEILTEMVIDLQELFEE
jgi:hypothetical protein